MAKQARPAPKAPEPSKEVWPLLEAFSAFEEDQAPAVLQEFLELVEYRCQEQSEKLLERAALQDRIRAVASRRK